MPVAPPGFLISFPCPDKGKDLLKDAVNLSSSTYSCTTRSLERAMSKTKSSGEKTAGDEFMIRREYGIYNSFSLSI